MLPRVNKISRALFKETTQKSKKIESENLSIRYCIKDKATQSRFSVVVPAKVSKKAVVRNKIKRQIYSVLKNIVEKKGFWGIIYVKKGTTDLDYTALNKEISGLITKI